MALDGKALILLAPGGTAHFALRSASRTENIFVFKSCMLVAPGGFEPPTKGL
jgi:hypothetical protein